MEKTIEQLQSELKKAKSQNTKLNTKLGKLQDENEKLANSEKALSIMIEDLQKQNKFFSNKAKEGGNANAEVIAKNEELAQQVVNLIQDNKMLDLLIKRQSVKFNAYNNMIDTITPKAKVALQQDASESVKFTRWILSYLANL